MKIKMKEQKFTELTDSIIRGANIEYGQDNTGMKTLNPNFDPNQIKYGTEKQKLETKGDAKSLQILELSNYHSELAKELRDKFQSKDIENPSPEITIINQEKWATNTVIHANYQAKKTTKINQDIIDPWTGSAAIDSKTTEQKIALPFVIHPDTLRELKVALVNGGQPRMDLTNGYIDHNAMLKWNASGTPSANLIMSVFALEIFILDNEGKTLKKIPIKFSTESEFNKKMGYTNDLLEQITNTPTPEQTTQTQRPQEQKSGK